MESPEVKKILMENNEFWQHKIDKDMSKFKKKIEKIQKLYQKDFTEAEKEHKAFLKKIKRSEK